MGNAIFGYQNLLHEPGVTLTPSSEAAAFPADNLKISHPSEFWRATTITSPVTLGVTLPGPRYIGLVAPICTNATPHTNLIRSSEDLSDVTYWTAAGLSGVTQAANAAINRSPHEATIWELADDTSTGEHKVSTRVFRLSRNSAGRQQDYPLHFSVWIGRVLLGSTKARIVVTNDPDGTPQELFRVDVGVDSAGVGTINSSSGQIDSVELADSESLVLLKLHRLSVQSTPVQSTHTDDEYEVEIKLLDDSWSDSFTGTNRTVYVAGPMFDGAASALRAYAPAGAEAGSLWWTEIGLTMHDALGLPLYSTEINFNTANGWIHSYFIPSTLAAFDSLTLYLHDPDNADGYLDLGALYIGPSLQVDFNYQEDFELEPSIVEPLVNRAAGGQVYAGAAGTVREWRLNFERQTRAFAAKFEAMRALVGSSLPIVCILNPDETVYGQEEIIYGRLTALRIRQRPYYQSAGASLWQVQMTIEELIP